MSRLLSQKMRPLSTHPLLSVYEKSDILYYVLYAVIADVLSKKNIIPSDIKNLDMDSVTDNIIENIRNRVYEIYKQHGGNGRVAKSAEFIRYIDNMLDE